MTKILEFKPRADGKAGRRKPETPADIIIFPGIRYERMGNDQPKKVSGEATKPATRVRPVLLQG